jgi:hypothetical protein
MNSDSVGYLEAVYNRKFTAQNSEVKSGEGNGKVFKI